MTTTPTVATLAVKNFEVTALSIHTMGSCKHVQFIVNPINGITGYLSTVKFEPRSPPVYDRRFLDWAANVRIPTSVLRDIEIFLDKVKA